MKRKIVIFILAVFVSHSLQGNNIKYISKLTKFIMENNTKEANKLLKKHIKDIYNNPNASYEIAKAFYNINKIWYSEELFLNSIKMGITDEKLIQTYYYLGEISALHGKYLHSIDYFKKGLPQINLLNNKLKSKYLDTYGYSEIETCNPDSGIKKIKKAIILDPNNKQAQKDLFYYKRWQKNNELVYPLENELSYQPEKGYGYYTFSIKYETDRKDMISYIPMIKLIIQNIDTKKKYGLSIKINEKKFGIYKLPIGNYKPVKISEKYKKGKYPNTSNFTISENTIVFHFARTLLYYSPEKTGKFNKKSRQLVMNIKDNNIKTILKKIENFNKSLKIINLEKN